MQIDDLHEQPSTSQPMEPSEAMETRHVADSVCNPVFCRDGVSARLEMLYNTADVKTHHHAVFVLIHALMLESGFYLKVPLHVVKFDHIATAITTIISCCFFQTLGE